MRLLVDRRRLLSRRNSKAKIDICSEMAVAAATPRMVKMFSEDYGEAQDPPILTQFYPKRP